MVAQLGRTVRVLPKWLLHNHTAPPTAWKTSRERSEGEREEERGRHGRQAERGLRERGGMGEGGREGGRETWKASREGIEGERKGGEGGGREGGRERGRETWKASRRNASKLIKTQLLRSQAT